MSLKETYEDLQQKASQIQHELTSLKTEMTLLEENIHGIELNPNFLETDVQPLYESLWNLQMAYKKRQTELNTVTLQLNHLDHILEGIMETDQMI